MATHPDRRHGSTDHNEYMRVSAAYSTLLGIHECGKGDRYVPETDSSDEEEECRAPPSTHTAKLSLPTVGTQQCNNTSLVGHKLLLVGEFGELQGGVAALRRWIRDLGGKSVLQRAVSVTVVVVSKGHSVPTAVSGLSALPLTTLVDSVLNGLSISDAGSYIVIEEHEKSSGRGRGRAKGAKAGVWKSGRGLGG